MYAAQIGVATMEEKQYGGPSGAPRYAQPPPQQQQYPAQGGAYYGQLPQQQQPGVIVVMAPPVESYAGHIVLSCVTLWCCCCPLGLVAFIVSMLAYDRARDQPESARSLGRAAMILSIVGIVIGVLAVVIYIVVHVTILGIAVHAVLTQNVTNSLEHFGQAFIAAACEDNAQKISAGMIDSDVRMWAKECRQNITDLTSSRGL